MKWSKWRHDDVGKFDLCYFGPFCSAFHPDYHNAALCRYRENGVVKYEANVSAGKYGETSYLFQTFSSAVVARHAVENAVKAAIAAGDLQDEKPMQEN